MDLALRDRETCYFSQGQQLELETWDATGVLPGAQSDKAPTQKQRDLGIR